MFQNSLFLELLKYYPHHLLIVFNDIEYFIDEDETRFEENNVSTKVYLVMHPIKTLPPDSKKIQDITFNKISDKISVYDLVVKMSNRTVALGSTSWNSSDPSMLTRLVHRDSKESIQVNYWTNLTAFDRIALNLTSTNLVIPTEA